MDGWQRQEYGLSAASLSIREKFISNVNSMNLRGGKVY